MIGGGPTDNLALERHCVLACPGRVASNRTAEQLLLLLLVQLVVRLLFFAANRRMFTKLLQSSERVHAQPELAQHPQDSSVAGDLRSVFGALRKRHVVLIVILATVCAYTNAHRVNYNVS